MSEKRSGCKGCFIWFLCLLGFFLLLVGVGLYLGYRKFVAFRDQYTQAKPLALPGVRYSQADLDAVQKRIDQFLAEARTGRTNARLALTDRDLNALIAATAFSNRAYLTLTNDAVVGQFSLPLDELGVRFLRGRYLNGSGVLDVGRINGQFSVRMKDLSVNGLKLPETYMGPIRQQNFAQGLATNMPVVESLERIGRIGVTNGQLVFEAGAPPVAK